LDQPQLIRIVSESVEEIFVLWNYSKNIKNIKYIER